MSDENVASEEASPPPDATAEAPEVALLRTRFGDAIRGAAENRGQWLVDLDREVCVEAAQALRDAPELAFDFLVDVTGLDHYGEEPRFRALYVLRSMKLRREIVLKVEVPEEDIWAPTFTGDWMTALQLEREAYDMFGIEFRGHPDLRRIMMPEVFEDFPLRKDFPMEGKMTDQEWAAWIIGRAQREEGELV